MITIHGNPFQEDEKYINNILKKHLRNLHYINGKKVSTDDFHALSPSSQATTAANQNGYSTSVNNYGETTKDLSGLLQSAKPLILKFQTQHKS
jgi:hypothetical protein